MDWKQSPSQTDQWSEYIDGLVAMWFADPADAMRHWRFCFEYSTSSVVVRVLNRALGGCTMRSKSGRKDNTNDKAGSWTRFVNVSLAGVKEADIERAYGDSDALANAIGRVLDDGYRIGISYDPGRDVFVASLTCRDDNSANAGCTLSGFAGTWHKALMVIMFKHNDICGGIWPVEGSGAGLSQFG